MLLKNADKCGLLVKLKFNVVQFNRSIVLGYYSIPKIYWGSFRGRFGDHFRVGDHFGGLTVPSNANHEYLF